MLADYREVRALMKPGDVVLFSGKGFLSRAIMVVTHAPVSHAGMVSFSIDDTEHLYRVRVTDSTQIGNRRGVFTRYLSEVIETYPGRMYWLPLSGIVRHKLNTRAMMEYLRGMDGAKYDLWQAARIGFNAIFGFNTFRVRESSKRVFCSEYVAFALEAGGAWDFQNASLVTPIDLARLPIYGSRYYQIRGDRYVPIPGFNGHGKT